MTCTSSARGFGVDEPWASFGCGGKRWRYLPDGTAEIENEGAPTSAWPESVNRWRDSVLRWAAKFGMAPAWLAAIMAIESGGKEGTCLKRADGSCSTAEGVGLMAIMTSTATAMAGRPVSWEELLSDNDLNIQLGAKYLSFCLQQQGGDPVKASVQYNAGKVKCGTGTVFGPSNEECPRSDWNVVEGCTLQARQVPGLPCAPSTEKPGKYVCSIDRPRGFIRALNAAVAAGWPGTATGPKPPPGPGPNGQEPAPEPGRGAQLLGFLAGLAAGYGLVQAVRWAAERQSSKTALRGSW